MSQIVRCDICGGIYNQSHLSSHKRLSHGKSETSAPSKSQPATLNMVLSMYARLSDKSKKKVRERLAGGDQTQR